MKKADRPGSVALWACAAAAALVVIVGTPAPAQAYQEGPYCWENYSRVGPGRVCTFYTFEQCLATASGVGGSCSQNAWYKYYHDEESAPVPPRRHRKVRRHVPS